jgi:hypothetical protein
VFEELRTEPEGFTVREFLFGGDFGSRNNILASAGWIEWWDWCVKIGEKHSWYKENKTRYVSRLKDLVNRIGTTPRIDTARGL